jgi:hypothetical protein
MMLRIGGKNIRIGGKSKLKIVLLQIMGALLEDPAANSSLFVYSTIDAV